MFPRRVAVLVLSVLCASSAAAQVPDSIFDGIARREIGPAVMSGRVADFAVFEDDPDIFYVASASGGLLKTTNGGASWENVFASQTTVSIGDVAINPTDPNVVWVGTGEANNRQSSSWGDGVYKSTDGGKNWKHMGLRESQHIGRIVIDPQDTDVVYVAALGRLWGANKERGVFKTTDGGATWQHVLAINEDTGAVDSLWIPPIRKFSSPPPTSGAARGGASTAAGRTPACTRPRTAAARGASWPAGCPPATPAASASTCTAATPTSSTPSSRIKRAGCSGRRTRASRGPRSTP
jgi:photosystem II stability/assembly factor-like uncharacterized protein